MKSSKKLKRVLSIVFIIVFVAGLAGTSFADQSIKAKVNGVRIGGSNRYSTSQYAYLAMDGIRGITFNSNVVIATGDNYPDALAAAYLAYKKNAALLLTDKNDTHCAAAFLAARAPYTNVFIVGGTGVISSETQRLLDYSAGKVTRIAGADRYGTNIRILEASGATGSDLLVCSGKNYPDALSASGVRLPILLVGNELTDQQKQFLAKKIGRKLYIVGGTEAVSSAVERELAQFGSTERLAGVNRYETSRVLAETFYNGKTKGVVLTRGDLFPDGLVAGPIAMKKGYPVLLVQQNNYLDANKFVANNKIGNSIAMGGNAAVPSQLVTAVTTWYGSGSAINQSSNVSDIVKALKANTEVVVGDVSAVKRKAVAFAMRQAMSNVIQNCYQLVFRSYYAAGIPQVEPYSGKYNTSSEPVWTFPYKGTLTQKPVPGDIAYYSGHVALYIGNGKAVHGGWYGNGRSNETVVWNVRISTNQLYGYWSLPV